MSGSSNLTKQEFKFVMRRINIRNSFEPFGTGYCTKHKENFVKVKECWTSHGNKNIQNQSKEQWQLMKRVQSQQRLLIQHDVDNPNISRHNLLTYVLGNIVRYLLGKLECKNCISELLLDPSDCHACKMSGYPMYSGFMVSIQEGRLIFPSPVVSRVVNATEVTFGQRVKEQGTGLRWVTSCSKDSEFCFGTVWTSDIQCDSSSLLWALSWCWSRSFLLS